MVVLWKQSSIHTQEVDGATGVTLNASRLRQSFNFQEFVTGQYIESQKENNLETATSLEARSCT